MYKAINVSEIHFAGRSFSVQLLASDMRAREKQGYTNITSKPMPDKMMKKP